MDNTKQKRLGMRTILLLWVIGLAGQLCWNLENAWFNTFVYANIGPYSEIVNWMVAVSAIVTTVSTFFFGTLSDRLGKRKPFISIGYIVWGIFTIVFGLTGLMSETTLKFWMIATIVVLADATMSFFGSMGNDSGFNAWTADLINDQNKGAIGTALAVQPVIGTIVGTVVGGLLIQYFGYLAFFSIMGGLVIVIGIASIFLVKDSPALVANKQGGFWHQFAQSFNIKRFFALPELVFVCLVACVYFIGFNVYFVHIGNLFIYNYGFTAGDAGIIQGIGLIIAILFTIPGSRAINKGKSPLVALVAIGLTIVGLVYLGLIGGVHDVNNIFSVTNIPLIGGVVLVGAGYVLITQTLMVWNKALNPTGSKGQYEGLRIVFFVLIPMVLGSAIAEPLIKNFGRPASIEIGPGLIRDGMAPNEILFYAAAIIMLLALIPLWFLRREFNKRMRAEAIAKFYSVNRQAEVQHQTPTPIFDKNKRHINPGFATDFVFQYSRPQVKKKLRLKEWDFYQIQHENYVVQLTIGHISFAQNVAINLIDLANMKTYSAGIIRLFKGQSMQMPESPSSDNTVDYVNAKQKVDLHYQTSGRIRHLYGSITPKDGPAFEVDVTLTMNNHHDVLVINTPFDHSPYHFYLNYKVSNMQAAGHFKMGDVQFEFNPQKDFGLLDWGRGVWPYHQVWYWGQVNDYLPDGRMIGLNLGYGFGNLAAASENMLFIDGVATKLGPLTIINDVTKDYYADWVIKSADGKVDLVMKTTYDRYSNTDFLVIYMKCHQVYGRYYGTITLANGEVITLNGQQGFFERSHNKW